MITAFLLSGTVFAGGLPTLTLRWRGGVGTLDVTAPAGEHINAEGSVRAALALDGREIEILTNGSDLEKGLAVVLGDAGSHALKGSLALALCEDGGTTCRLVQVSFEGQTAGRKGAVSLPVLEGGHGPHDVAPVVPVDQAFEEARVRGGLVLLDFSAVWCPPCNLMAAEVLHDPENTVDLAPFSLAMLDVDRPESWALKSRYKVGGYPTLIATRPDGTELDRLVGYPGEPEMLAWLASLQSQTVPLDGLASAGLTGADAGAAALRLAKAERNDEARAVLASADEGADARVARLMLDPKAADLAWLIERAPERVEEWGYSALDLDIPVDLRPRFAAVLDGAIAEAEPVAAADLLFIRAQLAPEAERAGLYAAAAAMLHAQLSGDPALDRGHYTYLADLYEAAGRPDLALAQLDAAIVAFPEEFTFHYAAAGLLMGQERYEEALAYAIRAESVAYGDNRLRAVERHARALLGLGRKEEARTLVDATLASAERPPEGVSVRTTRYLANLEKLRKELGDA